MCGARLADPVTVQIGEWHNSVLDGPGVETVGDKERYEGSFRAGKRHGYGQLTGLDKKVTVGPLGRRKAGRIRRLEDAPARGMEVAPRGM